MKLIEDYKKCKASRNKYRVRPGIKFYVDTYRYRFAFIPTITYVPWMYRHPNVYGIIEIWWLNFHIAIGKTELLSCRSCIHHDDCALGGSYYNDIMADTKKCPKFNTGI